MPRDSRRPLTTMTLGEFVTLVVVANVMAAFATAALVAVLVFMMWATGR